MESVLSFLHSIVPLEDDLEIYLRSRVQTSHIPKNTILLNEGSVCRTIGFIEKGIVKGYRINDDGSEVISIFMKEGDLFVSIRSFFKQSPSREIIQTLEPCIIHSITYEQFRYAHRTYRTFDALRGDLLEKYYLLSDEREEMRRQDDTTLRFLFLVEHYPDLIDRVLDKDLATFIKTSPEYFSAIKSKYRPRTGRP